MPPCSTEAERKGSVGDSGVPGDAGKGLFSGGWTAAKSLSAPPGLAEAERERGGRIGD